MAFQGQGNHQKAPIIKPISAIFVCTLNKELVYWTFFMLSALQWPTNPEPRRKKRNYFKNKKQGLQK